MMDRKFAITIFISLVFQISATKDFVTHSRSFDKDLIIGYDFRNEATISMKKVANTSDSSKVQVHIGTIQNIFSNSSRSYRCIYEYDVSEFGPLYAEYGYFTWLEDKKILALSAVPDIDAKEREWKLWFFDLNSCDHVKKNFPYHSDEVIVTFDSYDIYFKNETLCGKKYCRVTVDSQLNTVAGPIPEIDIFGKVRAGVTDLKYLTRNKLVAKNMKFVSQASTLGSDEGVIVKVSVITENGFKELLQYPSSDVQLNRISADYGAFSLVYENLTESSDNETVLNLHRFDYDGNRTLEMKLNFSRKIYNLCIKDVIDGGFLIVTDGEDEPVYTVNVIKYDANGRVVSRTLRIEGFKRFPIIGGIPLLYINKNEKNFYCILQWQPQIPEFINGKVNVTYFEKCFTSNDLESL